MLKLCRKMYTFSIYVLLAVLGINGGLALLLDEQTVEGRLLQLEAKVTKLTNELSVVQACSSDFCDIHWTAWAAWSHWSQCTGQCNQGYGSSEQTRTRTRTCITPDAGSTGSLNCAGNSTETDRRPCNAVELYGCLNSAQNQNNTYGMVYNFFDELAQSTCTAVVNGPSHIIALRRNCASGKAQECSVICSNAGYHCFEELHVYTPQNILRPDHYKDEGKVGLMIYRYFACTFGSGGCGPNYCCCRD